MCDNLPSISADQLTRAVAGTLSALDAPEEDEVRANENNAAQEKIREEQGKAKDSGEGSKSSLQLLECLSASIDPKLSKLQRLNEAHMAYTPSTSFYGRARKVSTKKKASEGTSPKSQFKKYSNRKNYKLQPPQLPNYVHTDLGKLIPQMLPGHVLKLCPPADPQQSSSGPRPACLPVSDSSLKPILVIQTSEILSLSSTSSCNKSCTPNEATSAHCIKNSANVKSHPHSDTLKSSSSPQMPITLPSNYGISTPSQALGSRLLLSPGVSVHEVAKCITNPVVPLSPQINSVIRLPAPLSMTSSSSSSSQVVKKSVSAVPVTLMSFVNHKQCPNQIETPANSRILTAENVKTTNDISSVEMSIALSPASAAFQSESVVSIRADSSVNPLSRESSVILSPDTNKQTTSSFCENEVKRFTPSNNPNILNISPPLNFVNSSIQACSNKGHCNISPGSTSLFLPNLLPNKVVQSPHHSISGLISKSVPVATCQHIAPRMSAIRSLNTASHSSHGPIFILPGQVGQLSLKLGDTSQTVMNVQSSTSPSANNLSNGNLLPASTCAIGQSSLAKSTVETKLCQHTHLVSSTKGPAAHPNILKLLQTATPKEDVRNRLTGSNASGVAVLSSAQTSSSSCLQMTPSLTSKTLIHTFSHNDVKTPETVVACSSLSPQSPPKSVSLSSFVNGAPIISTGGIPSPVSSPPASSSPVTSHSSSLSGQTNAVPHTMNTVKSTESSRSIQTGAASKIQLIVFTDPFTSKQLLQDSSNRPLGNVLPESEQTNSVGNLPFLKSPARALPGNSTSVFTVRNESQTTNCFTTPIAVSLSQKTKKETSESLNFTESPLKSPNQHLTSSHKPTLPSGISGSGNALQSRIQPLTPFLRPPGMSPPVVRLGPRSSVSGVAQNPISGSKLVISPAGISQLQSLMRKQGMSEGYFIISAKRGAAVATPVSKDLTVKKPCLSKIVDQISSHPHSDNSGPLVSPALASPLAKKPTSVNTTETTESDECKSSSAQSLVPQITQVTTIGRETKRSSHPISRDISYHKSLAPSPPARQIPSETDTNAKDSSGADLVSRGPGSEEPDNEETESDDESVSSSDSRSSSGALVIETNYDSDHEIEDGDNSTEELSRDGDGKENGTHSMDKNAPLNLSKDVVHGFEPSCEKSKTITSSSSVEEVSDIDQREKENESLSQSPQGASHLLDSERNNNFCIPQSPLTLAEIIRQQQYKLGLGYPPIPSPHFTTNKDMPPLTHGTAGLAGGKNDANGISFSSSDIPSSLSDGCISSHTLLSQHPVSDHQAVYERSLNTPHPFYPHDVEGDIHVHDSSDLEAAMNLQRLRECPPPMSRQPVEEINSSLPSSMAANVTSPKSPLSLSSMHQMEANANIQPPMTPNTMLINLLNRVPTPLLTNHHDLLTNPSGHETDIRLGENEASSMDPSSNKKIGHQIEKSFSDQGPTDNILSHQSASQEAIFDESSLKIIRSNSEVFAHPQNALDLIASNYLPPRKETVNNSSHDPLRVFSTSSLPENLISSSKPPQQDLFSDCPNVNMTLNSHDYCLNNFSSSLPSTSHQGCHHASSCSVPLTVTVNLDGFSGSSSAKVASEQTATVTTSGYVQEVTIDQESLTNNFTVLSNNLGNNNNNNNIQEKCGDADILRHLIQNTNTSSQSHLHQPPQHAVGLQFDSNAALFTPQIPDAQFETEMPSSFMHLNQSAEPLHKNLPCTEPMFDVSLSQSISFSMPLPAESSMETYSNLDHGPLQASQSLKFSGHSTFENISINTDTDLQNSSFNNGTSIAVFDTTSDAPFEATADSTFERNADPDFNNSQTDSSFQTEPNGAFIMSGSLTDIHTSFGGSLEDKDETTIHPRYMDANQKIHLSTFREDGEQSEMFFGQTNPSQSQPQSNDLHLYDMTSMHPSSNDIGFQMSMMEDHQRQLDNQQGVVPPVHDSSLPQSILGHQHDIHAHQGGGKDLQGHHYDFQGQASHQYPPDSTTTSFPGQQGDMGSYIQEHHSFPHYYNDNVAPPNLPLYSQHCGVASEAPAMLSISNMNCPIPPYSTASAPDLQFRFHTEEVTNDSGEKHPVLPSASFSPPSVADQATTPESGNMNLYNGTFQNMTVYDMYVRGGNTESRSQLEDNPVDSGNFCVECNTMYKSQCKFHPCDFVSVPDMPILSHARLTLPACLKLALSSVHGHTSAMGVFAKEKLSMRTKFGPLTGAMVSCDKLGSTRSFSLWQTFSGKNVRVIETNDENSSNWLMFVKPARVSAEQNLTAFQHGNHIYFVTRCEVKEGKELLYWFSKDYARMLGINAKPKSAQHQLCPHCHVCKQVFADRKQVRSHIRVQHPKPHVNKCPHCCRRFSQVSHLNAHVLAVHLRLKKFMCSHCGKRFNDSSNLRKHVKSHSEERNFKCQMCTKAFRQKAHLQIHMNTHMPVKHEQCGFCGERFTRTFERKQHELQHTKQHKIECQHCSKVFYKQKVYKEHLKIHRNERNFPCGYCGKAFRSKFALTRHGPACKQRKRTLTLAPTSSESMSSLHGQATTS